MQEGEKRDPRLVTEHGSTGSKNQRSTTTSLLGAAQWRATVHFAVDFASMWGIFIVTLLVAQPFDTARVRWQVTKRTPTQILRQDGVRSLYAGFWIPALTIGPIIAAVFAVNEWSKPYARAITGFMGLGSTFSRSHSKAGQYPPGYTGLELFLAGTFAGGTTGAFMVPFNVVRIQQQVAAGKSSANNNAVQGMSGLQVMQRTVKQSGLRRGLLRGFWLEVAVQGLGRGIYFWCYEYLKLSLGATPPPPPVSLNSLSHIDGGREVVAVAPLDPPKYAAAVATSLTWWFAIFPLEIVKTLIQSDPHRVRFPGGSRQCATEIWRNDGVKGFWRGYALTATRSVASSGLSLPMFDAFAPRARALADSLFFSK